MSLTTMTVVMTRNQALDVMIVPCLRQKSIVYFMAIMHSFLLS